jgi:hypothetical protein
MEMPLKTLSVIALVAVFSISSCKDDDDKSGSCENGAFHMTIDGEHFMAVSFDNTLLKGTDAGTDAKRIDIRATDAGGKQIIITFMDPNNGLSSNCVTTDEYIPFGEATTGTENVFMFTIFEDDMSFSIIEGSFDLTSCDASAQTVSGTFSFSDENVEVTNGSFTNMCYRVM